MEFADIAAFGLPQAWRILVDSAVMEHRQIVMDAGVRKAKLLLPPATLRAFPHVAQHATICATALQQNQILGRRCGVGGLRSRHTCCN